MGHRLYHSGTDARHIAVRRLSSGGGRAAAAAGAVDAAAYRLPVANGGGGWQPTRDHDMLSGSSTRSSVQIDLALLAVVRLGIGSAAGGRCLTPEVFFACSFGRPCFN